MGGVLITASLTFFTSVTYAQQEEITIINTMDDIPPLTIPITDQAKRVEKVYRLQSCDELDETALCYFVQYGSTVPVSIVSNRDNATLLSGFTANQECGVSLRNYLGIEFAKLQQMINVTYSQGSATAPARLNWGVTGGTFSTLGYSWNNLSGPNPSPGWGTLAFSLNATTSASLVWPGGVAQTVYSSVLIVNSSGTSCR